MGGYLSSYKQKKSKICQTCLEIYFAILGSIKNNILLLRREKPSAQRQKNVNERKHSIYFLKDEQAALL